MARAAGTEVLSSSAPCKRVLYKRVTPVPFPTPCTQRAEKVVVLVVVTLNTPLFRISLLGMNHCHHIAVPSIAGRFPGYVLHPHKHPGAPSICYLLSARVPGGGIAAGHAADNDARAQGGGLAAAVPPRARCAHSRWRYLQGALCNSMFIFIYINI